MFLNNPDPKMHRLKKISFLRCLDDLHFKCIFHKQSGSESGTESGSEIKVKVGSESEKKLLVSDPQYCTQLIYIMFTTQENSSEEVPTEFREAHEYRWIYAQAVLQGRKGLGSTFMLFCIFVVSKCSPLNWAHAVVSTDCVKPSSGEDHGSACTSTQVAKNKKKYKKIF